jgi:hypothetical protein
MAHLFDTTLTRAEATDIASSVAAMWKAGANRSSGTEFALPMGCAT